MKKTISFLSPVLMVLAVSVGAQAQELVQFSSGSVASAEDVNNNFSFLDGRLADLEITSSVAFINAEVDCTNDPAALRAAYESVMDSQNLSFAITGACYGNIQPDQRHGQVIGIHGASPEEASLIADDTGTMRLTGSFGGGLYVSGLTIDIPATQSAPPLLISRNSHGNISNLVITGGAEGGSAIVIQRGGQAYVHDIDVDVSGTALYARDGSSVALFGISILRGDRPLFAGSGSAVHMFDDITLVSTTAAATALVATSSTLTMNGGTLTLVDGGARFFQSSGEFNYTNFAMNHSSVSTNPANEGYYGFYAQQSDLNINATGMNVDAALSSLNVRVLQAENGASIRLLNSSGADLDLPRIELNESHLEAIGFNIQTLDATSSTVDFADANLTDSSFIQSSLEMTNFVLDASLGMNMNLQNSKAQFVAPYTLSFSALNCSGLSAIQASSDINYPASTNCLDTAAWDRLITGNSAAVEAP